MKSTENAYLCHVICNLMSNKKRSIKDWADDDKPREKMMNKGKAAMTDTELLAILIRTGKEGVTAVEVAQNLLAAANNSLVDLSYLSLQELTSVDGIGEAKAITIMAALEIGRRRLSAEASKKSTIGNSRDCYERVLPYIDDPRQEHFIVIYLNQKQAVLKTECVSKGGITHAIADPKIIFRNALSLGATALIMAHNHPSGVPTPSTEDRNLTKKFIAAGKLLDIKVIDHIIIGEGRYFSFLDNGQLDL